MAEQFLAVIFATKRNAIAPVKYLLNCASYHFLHTVVGGGQGSISARA
jgi:hypothetical protein